jgi:predicted transcriptional regulator
MLPHARWHISIDMEEFVTQLTPKRFELLRLAVKRRRSINELASASHHEPSAVSRDVATLQKPGFVRVELVANRGHVQMKIVTPAATRIAIDAAPRSA